MLSACRPVAPLGPGLRVEGDVADDLHVLAGQPRPDGPEQQVLDGAALVDDRHVPLAEQVAGQALLEQVEVELGRALLRLHRLLLG
jgi:hypothetical protein